MTVLLEGNNSIIFSAAATFIDENVEQASRWASKYIIPNKALKYIAAQYVEADKPNNNGQMWTHRDLSISRPTIVNSPMNLLHQSRRIVGTWLANEMLYPTEAAAEEEQKNPYIEVLGAYWKYYFPEELAYIEDSYRDGKLFVSMECVAETVTFRDGEREETYPYMGAVSEAYGDIAKCPGVLRQLNNPHFLGGALVFPPYSPGWKNAKVLELAGEKLGDRVEDTFAQVRAQNPHLSEGEVESLVAGTIGLGYREIAASAMEEEKEISVNVPSFEQNSINTSDQSLVDEDTETPEEEVTMKTFTEDELNEAIAKATAPLEAELAELKGASALESKVAEVTAEFQGQIDSLKAELDAAVLAAEGAKAEHAQLVEYLETTAAAEAAEREAAARKAERIAKVEEVASFPAEYIEKRADEWASMSDEAFDALVHDYAAVSTAAKGSAVAATESNTDDSIPAETAMHNEQKVESTDRMASIREVMRLNLSGVPLKNL